MAWTVAFMEALPAPFVIEALRRQDRERNGGQSFTAIGGDDPPSVEH